MQGKITINAVKKLKPGEILWDTETRGLGVRRQLRDAIYVVKTRINGQSRWITIGPHGAPWTPEKARTKAKSILGEIADGTDLAAIREEEKTAPTFAEFCDRYLKDAEEGLVRYRGQPKKPSTIATDRGRIERHIKPLLGRKLLKNITTGDIEAFMYDVAEGATKSDFKPDKKFSRVRVTGGQGTAARTVGLLGSIFSYARKKRLIDHNPVRGVERFADQRRTRVLTPKEWKALEKGLRTFAEEDGNPHAINIIRLIAFTGARRGEIVNLKCGEVDLKQRVLDLQDTKSGRSLRPLGRPAKSLLQILTKGLASEDYLFPSETEESAYQGFGKAWREIRDLAKLPPEITPHTLRHSFATVAGELGNSTSTIATLLGHKAGNVTERYVHRRIDRNLLAAADTVSNYIQIAMKENGSSKLIDFPTSR